ncbi:MAG: translation initiation factor IF-2 [Candidatus Methylarchaceae archaeon HK02M2]|nr:translation initiation factor IF-2 [Candidatus Methylarchaceae archaeon HK02M2]
MILKAGIRQPVVVVLGHVDSGKTLLLDKIRGTAVQAREAGGMTQHIGASFFPMDTLKHICGSLLVKVKREVEVPGLLVIDTPGHEIFATLRARGGSAADVSILVIDALRGFENQTYESMEILQSRKVPFVIALNKIDLIPGWRAGPSSYLADSLKVQDKSVIDKLDESIYRVVGTLSKLGFNSEAFYRVKDFTHEVAIVPISAKTGEGIPELLTVLIGLTQQYLKIRLAIKSEFARGIALEVKEEVGLGHTVDLILFDGEIRVGDLIILCKRDGAIISKVKAILMPKPLDEMRDPRDRFTPVDKVLAAAGVKIVASDLEGVLAGSPILELKEASLAEEMKRKVESEVSSVFISTDKLGVIVKSDTLGSLEAIVDMLKRREVLIRIADIGPVTRRDVVEATTVKSVDPYHGVIIAFGVKLLPDAEEEALSKHIKIFTDPVVYNLIQNYSDWATSEREAVEQKEFVAITPPCKILVLKGLVFRRSNPAVFGVEVLSGRLTQKATMMNLQGKTLGTIQQIQDKGESISEAPTNSQVAISIEGPTFGRNINDEDILYTLPNGEEVKLLLSKFKDRLTVEEIETLNEIIEVKRKGTPLWAY